jgi:hypothetical protein
MLCWNIFCVTVNPVWYLLILPYTNFNHINCISGCFWMSKKVSMCKIPDISHEEILVNHARVELYGKLVYARGNFNDFCQFANISASLNVTIYTVFWRLLANYLCILLYILLIIAMLILLCDCLIYSLMSKKKEKSLAYPYGHFIRLGRPPGFCFALSFILTTEGIFLKLYTCFRFFFFFKVHF